MCSEVGVDSPTGEQSIIGHSENKIITYFENEAGPGVLQSSVEQARTL